MHETASGKLEAEGVIGAILQPGRRHATPAYLPGLQSNVSSTIPAHIRLYQVQILLQTWPYSQPCHDLLVVHVSSCTLQGCKVCAVKSTNGLLQKMSAVHGCPHGNVTCQGKAALCCQCLRAQTRHTASSQCQVYHSYASHAATFAFAHCSVKNASSPQQNVCCAGTA